MISPTPLHNVVQVGKTPFLATNKQELDSFSFLGIGKKSDSSAATSTSTDTSSSGGGFIKTLGSIFTGVAGLTAAVAPVLPSLGIGSKSRIAEINATANGNLSIANAQFAAANAESENSKKQMETIMMIGGFALLLVIVLVIATRR